MQIGACAAGTEQGKARVTEVGAVVAFDDLLTRAATASLADLFTTDIR